MTLVNQTISHYRIVSKIGAGGMGEVYLAQDTKLDRTVALKILPADLASNHDRMVRFVREAKSAAALNHPNIATIHEIGESDGVNFIAMEFIDGATLREKIHQEQTELRKLLRYLQHAAEGLAKAHAAGILHRDLKPDNIMITRDGHAKILDFGLAKLIEPPQPLGIDNASTDEDATAILQQHSTPGVIMGTVGYMSPEQAQGKTNDMDQRSDIFSFGCILYEAVTGHKAFAGKDVVDSLNKIIREPVAPISDFRPDAPNHLQRIVRRCLAKDPEDRYQTIKDVAIELRDLRHELAADGGLDVTVTPSTASNATGGPGTRDGATQTAGDSISGSQPSMSSRASSAEYIVSGFQQHKLLLTIALLVLVGGAVGLGLYLHARTTGAAIESIAVMPFVNESGNAELEYLSDGMTETLIGSLSQLPRLNVKARSSVFRYKGKETDAKTIGKELNVQAILNGRVVQRSDQLTLSLELIDAQTENVIWSDKYDRKSSDLASLQNEIARDVSSKLKLKLSGAEQQKLAKTYTTDPEAYRLYLQGRFYWNKRAGKEFEKAQGYFQQAIEKDPKFALGYIGIADIIQDSDRSKAKEYIRRALEIDDQLAEGHASQGYMYMLAYDWGASERELKRAVELNPNYPQAHQWNGSRLMMLGKYEEALASYKRALAIDPTSAAVNFNYGACLFVSGRTDESIQQMKKIIEMEPTFPWPHSFLSHIYRQKGDHAAAVEERAKSNELSDKPEAAKLIRESFASGGWNGYLRAMVPKSPGSGGSSAASILAELGEKEQAIAALTKAAARGDYWLFLIKSDPFMDPLRGDPRFQELVKKFNPPQ